MSLSFFDHDITDLEFPLAASANIAKGAAVGRAAGYARTLQAADPFLGFAIFDEQDNSSGSAGDKSINLRTRGHILADIAGVAQTNLGDKVYMSNSTTFTLTSSSNSLIGHIVAVPETGKAIVKYELQQD